MKSFIFPLLLFLCCQATAQTFTEVHELTCGDSLHIGSLGYPTWNMPVIVNGPAQGEALIGGDLWYTLIYQSDDHFEGLDTVVVQCAHATQITCDTGIYVFHIGCPTNAVVDAGAVYDSFIYPNPASDYLYINGSIRSELRIAATSGAVIAVFRPGSGDQPLILPISHLPMGYYWLSYDTPTGPKNQKIAILR